MPRAKKKAAPEEVPAEETPSMTDLLDILPELQEIVEDDRHRRYRLGLKVRANDAAVFSGNPSNLLAFFAGSTNTRDPYFIIHNGLMRSVLRDHVRPLDKLGEFIQRYG